ncbi:MAG: hypothetical protein RIR70_2109 [Pseudomonadota bacterium]|jgi:hypothetical protein
MKRYAITLTAGLLLSMAAWAGGTHDHTPKNGGVVVETKDWDVELVVKPDVARIYLRGHGQAPDMGKAIGKLTLLTGKEKQDVELKPMGDKLEASGSFKAAPGTKAVVVMTVNGKPVTARFVLK